MGNFLCACCCGGMPAARHFLQKGIAASAAGKQQEAIALYNQALGQTNSQADVVTTTDSSGGTITSYGTTPETVTLSTTNFIASKNNLRVRILYNRGRAFRLLKQYQYAINDFNSALAINPRHEFSYALRGTIFKELKQPDKAFADFNSAIAINGAYAWALECRGHLLIELKRYREAVSDLECVGRIGHTARSIRLLTLAYVRVRSYQQALACSEQSFALFPETAKVGYAHSYRAQALEGLQRHAEAIQCYETALQLIPQTTVSAPHRAYYMRRLAALKSGAPAAAGVDDMPDDDDVSIGNMPSMEQKPRKKRSAAQQPVGGRTVTDGGELIAPLVQSQQQSTYH